MVNTLAASIRNYKWPTIATPILVLFEVACELSLIHISGKWFRYEGGGHRQRPIIIGKRSVLVTTRRYLPHFYQVLFRLVFVVPTNLSVMSAD